MTGSWEEKKRRVETARAWGSVTSQDKLAAELGYAPATFRRHLNGEGGVLEVDTLLKIAEVCEVPAWFMLAGWEGANALPADEADPEAPEDVVADFEAETGPGEETGDSSANPGADG